MARDEALQHRRLSIVNRNWKTVALDVEREILAHHAKPD